MLYDVRLPLACALHGAGRDTPAEERGDEDDERDPSEHVFAIVERTCVRVKFDY
jgi:hypothetical protein